MSHLRFRRSKLGPIVAAVAALTAWFLPSASEAAISVFYTATGQVSVSADGHGSVNATYPIRANKPSASATVRNAYLMVATTGFSGVTLGNSDIQLNGTFVTFTTAVPSAISSNNYLGEVTSIVKPTLDAAAAGITSFTVNEGAKDCDGSALLVVWNDPAQTQSRTVILLFGAQQIAGDTFSITLASPIDPNAAGALLDMGLGISFGFQPSGQVSLVDVNGSRLTSSAGGQDDGEDADGALITVGGIGDTNGNPPPNDPPSTDHVPDDELYSLLPFITNTTTTIQVHTSNPSSDDNIFLAYFNISGAAIVGEGIVLGPPTATNPVGTSHTVTATVVDANGAPEVGKTVTFTITSGPNSPGGGTSVTDVNGHASFTYTSNGLTGTDLIQASFVNSQQQVVTSNVVSKIWGAPTTPTPPITLPTVPTLDMKGLGLFALLLAGVGLFLAGGLLKR
jgi:hypothetical protein